VEAYAVDYSPVATLAARLLIDYPFRDWDSEPDLPFEGYIRHPWASGWTPRLVHDIEFLHAYLQVAWASQMDSFYPDNDLGDKPWGYLWAATIPCDECGRWFPLFGTNALRKPSKGDPGQSFELQCAADSWTSSVVAGLTEQPSTLRVRAGTKRNKLAWCLYPGCGHAHPIKTHQRISSANFGVDSILAVADLVNGKKVFRDPTELEKKAADGASDALANLRLSGGLMARPDEQIAPGNAHSVGGLLYGARTYGDLSNDRQNLSHAVLCLLIGDAALAMERAGCSTDYASTLAAYMTSILARKLRRSTRGARLEVMSGGGNKVGDVFVDEAGVGYNYDYFETSVGEGPGTWTSVIRTTPIARQCESKGRPATVRRGSALNLTFATNSVDAVVTDPPYGDMIEYADSSDFFYAWIKRAVSVTNPELAVTSNPLGTQEKDEELIVLRMASGLNDHRTEAFYEAKISEAFGEANRVVKNGGVVTIVFGHGDPDVWKILLTAIEKAGLVLTGAWPAQTEQGGSAGSSNIVTTLTLACRPAPADRPEGRVAEVDAEVRRLVAERVKTVWEPAGLAYTDQKMAAAGPAMEVVGRYSRVLDKKGRVVDITRYLPLARRAVTDTHDLRFDKLPLGTFDAKTQFSLEWVRSHGRDVHDASEARWQRLAADLEEADTAGVLKVVPKGLRLAYADEVNVEVVHGSPIFDVALAAAAAWQAGSLADSVAVFAASERDPDDQHLWACIHALGKNLPEGDRDGIAWTQMVRVRPNVVAASRSSTLAVEEQQRDVDERRQAAVDRPQLFEDPNSLFGHEGDES
jgi:adenine-specific DNA methylase